MSVLAVSSHASLVDDGVGAVVAIVDAAVGNGVPAVEMLACGGCETISGDVLLRAVGVTLTIHTAAAAVLVKRHGVFIGCKSSGNGDIIIHRYRSCAIIRPCREMITGIRLVCDGQRCAFRYGCAACNRCSAVLHGQCAVCRSRDGNNMCRSVAAEHRLNGSVSSNGIVICLVFTYHFYTVQDSGLSIYSHIKVIELEEPHDLYEQARNSYAYRMKQLKAGIIEEGESFVLDDIQYARDTESLNLYPLEEEYGNEGVKAINNWNKNIILKGGLEDEER